MSSSFPVTKMEFHDKNPGLIKFSVLEFHDICQACVTPYVIHFKEHEIIFPSLQEVLKVFFFLKKKAILKYAQFKTFHQC